MNRTRITNYFYETACTAGFSHLKEIDRLDLSTYRPIPHKRRTIHQWINKWRFS